MCAWDILHLRTNSRLQGSSSALKPFETQGLDGPEHLFNLAISLVVLVAAYALALTPEALDRPLVRLINQFANRSWLFDYSVAAISKYFTFSGVILMALIWYVLFDEQDADKRAYTLVGTLASLVAGVVSRTMQRALPSHLRPYYDSGIDFHRPLSLEPHWNPWHSFPSDHVAVFAGLAIVLYIARPSAIVYLAIAWTIIVESLRSYMGAHYPSDLIGGAALASCFVWFARMPSAMWLGHKLMRVQRSYPGIFFGIAFFMSYQISTLFLDVRNSVGPVRDHFLKHNNPMFSGDRD